MREIIAHAVAAEPDEYCEAMLGRPNKDYCEWIMKPNSWGGAIELSILSKFYGLEIAVVDSSNGILNRFGEDQHYAQRVFLIFDGIHYDPLYLEPLDASSFSIKSAIFSEISFTKIFYFLSHRVAEFKQCFHQKIMQF